MSIYSNSWFVVPKPSPSALARIFCFVHAGGSASAYRDWAKCLSEKSELVIVQLPGRDERFSDALIDNLNDLIKELRSLFPRYSEKPCVLFGHSLGARVAFEVANLLNMNGKQKPSHLIVSGARAPHLAAENPIHDLPDNKFIEEIRKHDGTPDEIIRDKELLRLLLPRLRADYKLADTAPLADMGQQLDFPITALGGESDLTVSAAKLKSWSVHTGSEFSSYFYPGGHFFINSSRNQVIERINNTLNNASC